MIQIGGASVNHNIIDSFAVQRSQGAFGAIGWGYNASRTVLGPPERPAARYFPARFGVCYSKYADRGSTKPNSSVDLRCARRPRSVAMISSLYLHSRSSAKALRIGVLVDGFQMPKAFHQVLTDIDSSDFAHLAVVIVNREQQPAARNGAGGRGHRLFALYAKFDARRKRHPDPLEIVDCADLLGDLQRLDVAPVRERCEHRFAAEAIAQVRAYDLDVLLQFGFDTLRGEILDAARYGIWSFHYGDNEFYLGGPPLFWEVEENNPVSGAVLQVLTRNIEAGIVLCKSLFATMPGVWRSRNSFDAYWGSAHFVIRKLHELHECGWETVQKHAIPPTPYRGKASPYRTPTNTRMLRWLVPKIGINLAQRLNPFRGEKEEHWRICLARNASSRLADHEARMPAGFRWLECPAGHSYADPFLFERQGQLWLFFEDFSYRERRGRIVCAPVLPDLSIGPVSVCLDLPYHLSYPFVFEHGGEIFMIPESSANETVDLWRATEFPFQWSLEKTLFRGRAVDTTPLLHDGRWYFFAALMEPRGRPAFGALFFADDLTGEWVHHPGSPICTDVRRARSAGPIQRLGGRLLRPVQDCAESYGRRIHVHEILELTPATYREQYLHSIEPDWEANLTGVHTYGTCGGIEVLDAATLVDRRKVFGAGSHG